MSYIMCAFVFCLFSFEQGNLPSHLHPVFACLPPLEPPSKGTARIVLSFCVSTSLVPLSARFWKSSCVGVKLDMKEPL